LHCRLHILFVRDVAADEFRAGAQFPGTGFALCLVDIEQCRLAAGIDEAAWNRVVGRLDYVVGDALDPELYAGIGRKLSGEDGGGKRRNVLFYLAVAARFFGPIVKQLGKAGLTKESEGDFRRVIIEKPFGHDLVSAGALNREILGVLREHCAEWFPDVRVP